MTGKGVRHKGIRRQLTVIYRALYGYYGPQHWWPGDTPLEVMVGAVLTQNTAWSNVEKALENLKQERLLTLKRLHALPLAKLAGLIRPSGYYNIKARRLKHLLEFIQKNYGGVLSRMFADDGESLRTRLLSVNGIGPETADSILLYAAGKPYFVVDAYTKRVLSRHCFVAADADYQKVQRLFMEILPNEEALFNEYHALIVRVGKDFCRKSEPPCGKCPLGRYL